MYRGWVYDNNKFYNSSIYVYCVGYIVDCTLYTQVVLFEIFNKILKWFVNKNKSNLCV